MTNVEVQAGFTEVYNRFWLNYRDKPLPKDSDEWERMHTWAVVLMKKIEDNIARNEAQLAKGLTKSEIGEFLRIAAVMIRNLSAS